MALVEDRGVGPTVGTPLVLVLLNDTGANVGRAMWYDRGARPLGVVLLYRYVVCGVGMGQRQRQRQRHGGGAGKYGSGG